MKIAMLTNNYKPFVGGVPISVERQAKELAKFGHNVTVFAPEYETDCRGRTETGNQADAEQGSRIEYEDSVRIIRFGVRHNRMENGMVYPKMILPEVTEVFRKETFDLIHVHHPMFVGPTALHLGRKYHLPVVYTYHTRYEDYLHYLSVFQENRHFPKTRRRVMNFGKTVVVPEYMRWFTNQCDLVLAPTAGMMKRIREKGTDVPMAVFPTGLETEFYLEYPKEAQQIRRAYLPEEGYLFCTTGRLEEEKNPRFLLDGIWELKQKIKKPFRVLMIGDGSMRKELEEEARQRGIADVISFVGNVDNQRVNRYLQACDVFLFASKSETQGIVLAEAFAAGCPVVAVKASGVEDIVKNGRNGFQTEENPKIWAEKVIEAVECGEPMRENARLTASAYRASRLAVYEELLYGQCIAAKQKKYEEELEYEYAANWKKHSSESISGIFKAS